MLWLENSNNASERFRTLMQDDYQPIKDALDMDARMEQNRGKYDRYQYNQNYENPRIQVKSPVRPTKKSPAAPQQIAAQLVDEPDKQKVDEGELLAEIKDLMNVIKNVGVDEFTQDLMAKHNEETVEKVMDIEKLVQPDGKIDEQKFYENNELDLSEIQQEISEIVEENDVQAIVEEEASEEVKEEFEQLTNELDTNFGDQGFGAQESATEETEGFEPEVQPSNDLESEPENQADNGIGSEEVNELPIEPVVPNDPWFDGADAPASDSEEQPNQIYGQEGEDQTQIGEEFGQEPPSQELDSFGTENDEPTEDSEEPNLDLQNDGQSGTFGNEQQLGYDHSNWIS